jgi:hypothetical protein
MPKVANFPQVFDRLKHMLIEVQAQEPKLKVITDKPGGYYLHIPYVEKYRKELWFGGVEIKKNYVSFHLVPLYVCPDMVAGMSDKLRKRMQGKGCLNFTAVDDDLFTELEGLIRKGIDRFRQENIL